MNPPHFNVSAKGCHACKFLEWHDDDTDGFAGPNSGWGCGKRAPNSPKAEKALTASMQLDAYRNRYKRCFEPRPTPTHSSEAGE